jgi:ABC-2 type transport system permease protein
VHWFKVIATYNPVSYLIEGIRSLIIKGWDAQALGLAFGFAALLLAISLSLAGVAMKNRLVRT